VTFKERAEAAESQVAALRAALLKCAPGGTESPDDCRAMRRWRDWWREHACQVLADTAAAAQAHDGRLIARAEAAEAQISALRAAATMGGTRCVECKRILVNGHLGDCRTGVALADAESAARAHDAGVERAALEWAAKECDKAAEAAMTSRRAAKMAGRETVALCRESDAETAGRIARQIRALAESARTTEDRRANERPAGDIAEAFTDLPPGATP